MNKWNEFLRWVLKHTWLHPYDARQIYLRLRSKV